MALSHGPKIVTDGLVLALDAADRSSYSGSGTTWNDLSGNNNGTLVNGPTYDSGNNGSLVFNGVDDKVTLTAGSNFAYGTGDFTIEGWFYCTTALPNYGSTLFAQTASTHNYIWVVAGDGNIGNDTPNIISFYFGTGGGGTAVLSSTSWSYNTWNHFVVSRISGSVSVYLNSVPGTPVSCTQNFTNTTYVPTIGLYTHGDENGFGGRISTIKVYNGKGLTEDEVLQNFNALRGRFGVSKIPQIVTDGLVLNLDAGDSASYSGSGTTWTDLSGNGNNGTLVNGPTYDSGNGGSIVFDGVNDYATLSTNLVSWDTGNPFTFSIWFKTTSTGIILGQQNTSTPNSASGYVPAIYVGSDGLLYTSCFWGSTVTNQSVSHSSLNSGTWNNITVTFSSNSQISYLNGTSYATLSKTQSSYSATYYYFLGTGSGGIWDRFPSSPYFSGNISQASLYNRALSAEEISQNFNALRDRYGI